MKAVLAWIRWKYAAPLLVFIAALVIFFVVFFDALLARGIEKFASKANGAKVEVSGLKTKFIPGRLTIARVQVTDAQAPMQNLVEAGPLAFQASVSDLISRRVIIEEATLEGLAFNTPRKTSGALPKSVVRKQEKQEPPSAAAKLAEKYKERFKLNIDGIKGDVKAKIDFDPKDLELVRAGDALKEKAKNLPADWQKRVNDLNVDARLKKADEDLKAVRATPTSGTEALTSIPAGLKKLGQVKADLDALKKDLQAAKSSASGELAGLKSDTGALANAKKKDADDLMSRLNLDFANPEKLVEGLIGPLVVQRFQTVLHYVELARKYMPSKKEKETLPSKPRAEGMDIEFPTPAAPPRFWLMKAALSGVYESIRAAGTLSNLTSDPARVGQPFKLDLSGAQGAQTFSSRVVLDHTGDSNKDSLALKASGFDVKKMMGDASDGPRFSGGVGSADLALSLFGEEAIGGQLNLGLSGLKLDEASLLKMVGADDKLKADFMRSVIRAVESMKEVSIAAQIFGTWKEPGLKISSNLSPVLANVVKDSIGNAVKDQRKQLEQRLDQLLADKQKDVNSVVAGLDGKVNAQFGGAEAKIQQKISEATGINLSGGESAPIPGVKIPSLDKLFKK